jgi:ABC-type branched-subunit amino acid transport system permease subunit
MTRLSCTTTIVLVLGGAILLAVLNLMTEPGAALHAPTYVIALVGKYLCFAILALAVDLVWGFAGILTLGHAAFFALGGYAMGMYLMRQIGARGVYSNPILPDFMVFLGWHELPWYWHGFNWFAFAAVMVVLVPGLLALVFGWLAFRSRVSGVYLSIITQALTYALLLAFFRNDMGFGGNNGMTDFKDILGYNVQEESTRCALLVITAALLCVQFLVARYLVMSRFGKVLIAHPLSGLPAGVIQAGGLGGLRGDGWHRRCAVRASGRHHQPIGVCARELDRGGDLGRCWRPRHAVGRHPRRGPGEFGQDLFHLRVAGMVALCTRRHVHLRHPAAAAGIDGTRPAPAIRGRR